MIQSPALSRILRTASLITLLALGACDDPSSSGDGGNQPGPAGRAVIQSSQSSASADASAGGQSESDGSSVTGPPWAPVALTYSVTAGVPGLEGFGSSSLRVDLTVDGASGELAEFAFVAAAAGSGVVENGVDACGGGNTGSQVVIEVLDHPVAWEFSGAIEPGRLDGDVRVRIRRGLPDGGWDFPHVFDATEDFTASGQLEPGTYMIQVWCQTNACASNAGADTASLDGVFRIVDQVSGSTPRRR